MAIDGTPPTKIPPGAIPVVARTTSVTQNVNPSIYIVPAGRRFVLTGYFLNVMEGAIGAANTNTHTLQSSATPENFDGGVTPTVPVPIARVITASADATTPTTLVGVPTTATVTMTGLAIPYVTGIIQLSNGAAAANAANVLCVIYGYEETIAG